MKVNLHGMSVNARHEIGIGNETGCAEKIDRREGHTVLVMKVVETLPN